jgi:hypothetical protein
MSSGLPDFASVSVLAIDPLTPANVYSVVFRIPVPPDFQSPSGVFKSTDAGQSWVAKNTGLGSLVQVTALAIDPCGSGERA